MPKTVEITEQDKAFIELYLSNGLKRIDAMLNCGRGVTTRHSAGEMAYRTLKKPEVRAYIAERLKGIILSTDQVLAGVSALAESADNARDRLKAYELIGKHHKLFADRTELTGPDGKPIESTSTIIIQGVKPNDGK